MRGSRGGAVPFSRSLLVGTTGAEGFDFDFVDIDLLTFTSAATAATTDPFGCGAFNCTQFTLDNVRLVASDIVVPPPPPGSVPEPASFALVALAGAAMAAEGGPGAAGCGGVWSG